MRQCMDYWKLKQVMHPDLYLMPRINDMLNTTGESRFFLKVDLLNGFYQVPLSKRAREASTFITPDGLFQYTVMLFGMRNAGSTF